MYSYSYLCALIYDLSCKQHVHVNLPSLIGLNLFFFFLACKTRVVKDRYGRYDNDSLSLDELAGRRCGDWADPQSRC